MCMYVYVKACVCVRACVRMCFLGKSKNAVDNAWKEKESVKSLCLDFTQHPLSIRLHIAYRIIFTLLYLQLMNHKNNFTPTEFDNKKKKKVP